MKNTTPISRTPIARTLVGSLLGFRASSSAVVALLFAGLTLVKPVAAQLQLNPGILIADFNHDGIPDALVPSPNTSSFTLSFGSVPFGTFSPVARSVGYPAGCTSTIAGAIAVADFNGDGIPDIALTCVGSPTTGVVYQVYVMLGTGDGSFIVKSSFAGQLNLLAGDFNKDGRIDLVTAGSNGTDSAQAIVLMKGTGDGTFTAGGTTPIASITYPTALATDLNGDGYPEVVLGNFGGQAALTLEVYGNNQDGTFGTPATNYLPSATIPVGTYPESADEAIIAGNFYGSGLTDLAVVDVDAPGVFVIKNNSTDGFAFADAVKTAYPALVSASAASFTSNLSDLVVYDGAKLTVLANSGTGTFAANYAALSVANTSGIFAAADANGDGHADIYAATLTATGASLSVDLVSGSASAKSAAFALPAGTSPIGAAWPGNINFTGTTLTGSQVVNGLTTVITLASSKNPSALGDSVTFTATVTPAVSGNFTATGTVTFLDGTTTLGTGTLGNGGVATFATAALTAGAHNISAMYGGDSFFGATALVTPLVQQVISAPTITWATPAAIIYGTPLSATQLNATATNLAGAAVPGAFAYTPAAGTVLTAGTQTLRVTFTPTDLNAYTVATSTVQLLVNKATPVITWTTPASIPYGTALSATQLNATGAGVAAGALPGTFVYTPAAGVVLAPGVHTLSVAFTPTDAANYTAGAGTVQLNVTDITLSSFTPNTAQLGDAAKTITATGSGIVATTVVQVNGTAIATTILNATTLTAVIPASDFLTPGSLQITLSNPATGSVSPALAFTVTAPSVDGTLTGPPTAPPATQPTLTFTVSPYPVDVVATLTITQKSSLPSGVTDPMVMFSGGTGTTVSNNGKTVSFTIAAGTTAIPTIALQAGTVAETITITPVLTVSGVDVTPAGLAPAIIDVPASVPASTATTLTRNGDQLVVTFAGYSNTREIVGAKFHFVAAEGATIETTDFTPPVADLFTTWYANSDSQQEGSSFTYTQNFTISNGADKIASVEIVLTNTIGDSTMETAQ